MTAVFLIQWFSKCGARPPGGVTNVLQGGMVDQQKRKNSLRNSGQVRE